MISRRDSLHQALEELEAGGLAGMTTLVFSRRWWKGLPLGERTGYRERAKQLGVSLRTDENLVGHYVEVRGEEAGPSLSSELPA